jgi:hypothetical protein
MSYLPLIVNAGQLQQLPSGEALNVGGWTLPIAGGTEDYVLIADASGNGIWSSDLDNLTRVNVDSLTLNDNDITSSTGTVNFNDDNLTTTGKAGVGTSSVYANSQVEIVGAYTVDKYYSALHIRTTSNTYGTFIGSSLSGRGIWSSGAHFATGSDWKARATGASGIDQNFGVIQFFTDTGLTDGVDYTPTSRGYFDASGLTVVGTVDCDNLTVGSWSVGSPTAAAQLLRATGADAASWTTDITGLTSLNVDNITIDGSVITDSTGLVEIDDPVSINSAGASTLWDLQVGDVDALLRIGEGSGSGHAVIGNKSKDEVSASEYEVYLADNAYWDSTAEAWTPVRSTLGRRAKFAMGFHQNAFTWDYSDPTGSTVTWTELMNLDYATGDLFVPTGGMTLGSSSRYASSMLDIKGPHETGAYASQINLHTTAKSHGLFAGSWADGFGIVSAGCHYNAGGDFLARHTEGSSVYIQGDLIEFNCDNGLTKGTTFTPTQRFRVDQNGATVTGTFTVGSWGISAPTAVDQAFVSTAANAATWYTTALADVLKIETPSASGAERKYVLTAGSGEKFAIESAPWPLTLTADETIYVRTTGNDTTGDGSAISPFASIQRTVEYLGGLYIGDYTVTVDIGEGVFSEVGTVTMMHPFGAQIIFQGVSENISSQSISSISGTTSYGHDNLYYRNMTMVLPVGKSVSVGDYIACKNASGGTNPNAINGLHKVSVWVSGTRTATVEVAYRNGSETPSGSITCDIALIKTVIAFSNMNGIKITGPYYGGTWRGLVIQGNYNGSNNAKNGIWALNTAVVSLCTAATDGYAAGVWGFQTGLYSQNNGLIFADYGWVSKAGQHLTSCQNGGILSLRSMILNACNNSGIFAFNGSTVSANSITVVGTGNNSVYSYQGSFIDITSSFVGESNSTTSVIADRWSAIDGTGATVDDAISPAVDGNNDGSYVIGL